VPKSAGFRSFLAIVLAGALIASGKPVEAQRRIGLLRDAETEHIIRTMSRPIFDAAGLDPDTVQILLVNDPGLNAFVAGGQNIFLHTGLILHSDDPLRLLGVIAHETGHIAGGHLVRGRDAMEGASAQALLSMLLGVAAVAASGGAAAGAGAAVMSGGAEMARRAFLSFNRTQESSADQAGLSYLERAGLSPRGMLEFLEFLAVEDARPTNAQVEYVRTHPLTQDRVSAVRFALERSRHAGAQPKPEIVEMHRRMRAKLYAYVNPQGAMRRYPESDTSIVARYARAYSLYRRNEIPRALQAIDGLIAAEPNNPFFHELRGEMLVGSGRIAEAIPSYRRAVELVPTSALIQTAYAQALLETGDNSQVDTAIRALETALRYEERSAEGWRLLAVAWNRKGDQGKTAYATAEAALSRGDRVAARHWSERAMKLLPTGSPHWLRAQDIRLIVSKERTEE